MLRLLLPLFVLCTGFNFAATTSSKFDPKIRELIQKSGLERQLINSIQGLKMGVVGGEAEPLGEEEKFFVQEMGHYMTPERMLTRMGLYMETSMDKSTLTSILVFLNSDLGKKVTAMEEEASSPEFIQKLAKTDPATLQEPKRSLLIDQLIASIDWSQMYKEMSIQSINSIEQAQSILHPEEAQPVSAEAKHAMINQIDDSLPAIQLNTKLHMLATYKNLSESELQTYVIFNQSDLGKIYNKIVMSALTQTFAGLMGDFFIHLEKSMAQSPSKPNKQ